MSLYSDIEDAWLTSPAVAFMSLLDTESFKASSKSTSKLPPEHKTKPDSAKVYEKMFAKYLRHLESEGSSFVGAELRHVDSFLNGVLGKSTKDTVWRYLRLLERVYEHLTESGFIESNPVTAWVKGRLKEGKSPKVGRDGAVPPVITRAEVERLQDWLYTRFREQFAAGRWTMARDLTLGALSLGSGLRCAELLLFQKDQVTDWEAGSREERFRIEVPAKRTVRTGKTHQTSLDPMCVDIFSAYFVARNQGFPMPIGLGGERPKPQVPKGDLVFPANMEGQPLMVQTVYRSLKRFATLAVEEKVLQSSVAWVLTTGAQGLRRAFAQTELEQGASGELLENRLGYHSPRSVRKLKERIAMASKRAK